MSQVFPASATVNGGLWVEEFAHEYSLMGCPDEYRFRRVVRSDLPLLARWRSMPHVIEWWGDPDRENEDQKLGDDRIAMWIVDYKSQPLAFAQDYDVHGWVPHSFSHLPVGSRGIDQYIGEPGMLGEGHGSVFVRMHVRRLFELGVPAVGTDPHPDNERARRAYENAGFTLAAGPVHTRWGKAVLMECWPHQRDTRQEVQNRTSAS